RALQRIVAIDWLILVPLRLWQRRLQLLHQRAKRRRDDRLGQKTNTRALFWSLLVEYRTHLTDERRPRLNIFTKRQCWRAIRIVKTQNRRLGENVCGARATRITNRILRRKIRRPIVGMIRIALDLGWSSFITANDDGCRRTKQRRRRRKEKRFTRNLIFRLFDVRNDFLRGLENATTQSGESQRSAHQLDKRATLDGRVPLLRL